MSSRSPFNLTVVDPASDSVWTTGKGRVHYERFRGGDTKGPKRLLRSLLLGKASGRFVFSPGTTDTPEKRPLLVYVLGPTDKFTGRTRALRPSMRGGAALMRLAASSSGGGGGGGGVGRLASLAALAAGGVAIAGFVGYGLYRWHRRVAEQDKLLRKVNEKVQVLGQAQQQLGFQLAIANVEAEKVTKTVTFLAEKATGKEVDNGNYLLNGITHMDVNPGGTARGLRAYGVVGRLSANAKAGQLESRLTVANTEIEKVKKATVREVTHLKQKLEVANAEVGQLESRLAVANTEVEKAKKATLKEVDNGNDLKQKLEAANAEAEQVSMQLMNNVFFRRRKFNPSLWDIAQTPLFNRLAVPTGNPGFSFSRPCKYLFYNWDDIGGISYELDEKPETIRDPGQHHEEAKNKLVKAFQYELTECKEVRCFFLRTKKIGSTTSHLTLVFLSKSQTVYFFDPESPRNNIILVYPLLFATVGEKGKVFCNSYAPQSKERKHLVKYEDPIGYCLAWCALAMAWAGQHPEFKLDTSDSIASFEASLRTMIGRDTTSEDFKEINFIRKFAAALEGQETAVFGDWRRDYDLLMYGLRHITAEL